MARRRIWALAPIAIVLLAGCGGAGATQGPVATQPGGGAATAGPSTAGPATAGPVATPGPVATQSGGGGGTATAACELLTVEEAANVLGTAALTTTGGELSGQTFCDYRTASGEGVLTTYMQAAGAGALWGLYESSLTTDPVSGIGDKAMFEPSTKLLLVLKGDSFFNVFVADINLTPEQALEKEKQLAQIMVGRL